MQHAWSCYWSVLSLDNNHKFLGKVSPRSQLVLQMFVANQISFHDPIFNEQELKEKELLLSNWLYAIAST